MPDTNTRWIVVGVVTVVAALSGAVVVLAGVLAPQMSRWCRGRLAGGSRR